MLGELNGKAGNRPAGGARSRLPARPCERANSQQPMASKREVLEVLVPLPQVARRRAAHACGPNRVEIRLVLQTSRPQPHHLPGATAVAAAATDAAKKCCVMRHDVTHVARACMRAHAL